MPDAGIAPGLEPRSGDTVTGRQVVHVMGTVVSFDLRDRVPLAAYDEALAFLHQADQVFSTYRANSDISRLQRGELRISDCHPDVEEVLDRCRDATERTGGYFTAYPHGQLDPTGLVKGWAIQRVSQMLTDAGSCRHAVNGGGDIQLVNDTTSDPWHVGIADPNDRTQVIAVAVVHAGAIATSGTAERGDHIINPYQARPARHFASVTITAANLVDADVFATAAFAMGEGAVSWVEHLHGLEGLYVQHDGSVIHTSGFLQPSS